MKPLDVLSAGAAQGVVTRLAAEHGFALNPSFGAVGAMKEKLLSGAPCDLLILTRALIDELAEAGRVGESADLGTVRTGVAVRSADPAPEVSDPATLRQALLAADALYFPDPQKATAGIHFAGVLASLGLKEALAPRLRAFPNGAAAMREMAGSADRRPLGCTQITEINNTPGVKLVAALPREFELVTVYSCAIVARGAQPEAARRFMALLAGEASRRLRRSAGFEC